MSTINALNVTENVTEVDAKDRIERIKSKGYWRVNFCPIEFEEHRIDSLDLCWEIIEDCRVFLRGWDYPAVSEKEKAFGDDYVQSGADFRGMIELWRFYQSGQFIHYFSCLEDYWKENVGVNSRWLGEVSTLYRVTEIYEFATRLAMKDVFKNGVIISIKLEGMKDRQLFEPDRPWVWKYISNYNDIAIESKLSIVELIASAHNEAINKTMEIYSKFGFTNPSKVILSAEQQRLLEQRL